ncbi:MAG: hypothetical protein GWN31_15085 [Candidatus Thorarchaeota archaeon]|nr:hypothetical protein [Candidatus Thorarchaeota archaeon]NIW15218.1 hypothetical protein [Candidatus Thorarchaeota archaeon]NIW53195.1 hypothetical protein [Candidatus Korarchaeota archaeon]
MEWRVVYSEKYEWVDYGRNHPLQADRFKNTRALIKEEVPEAQFVEAKKFSPEILRKAHSPEYIERVKEAGKSGRSLSVDTPAFPKIYEWGVVSVYGSLTAGTLILEGKQVTFNPCGGWHHAGRNSGGGFCVFNDIAILAKYLIEKGRKPVIIDIDAHAGDGTMHILEEEPILKISIHQDPSTFYPGDGFINQVGKGRGVGYTVNVPLPPGSDDGCLLYVFDKLVAKLLETYDFDVILFQSGVDGHIKDPLSDLRYTGVGYVKVAEKLKEAGVPIVMVGGGGYQNTHTPLLWLGILLNLIGREEKALEITQQADGFSDILSEGSCLEMTTEIVKDITKKHPSFYSSKSI